MRMIADDGSTLDAEFRSSPTGTGFDIVIESRGGSTKQRPPRNPDYNSLLRLLLKRVSQIDAVIRVAAVETARTRNLSVADRIIRSDRLKYPIALEEGADFESLRRELTRPQAAIGRVPGARGPGNMSKRIRISFDWRRHRVPIEDLEQLLVEGNLYDKQFTQGKNKDLQGQSMLDEWNQKVSLYEGASPRTTVHLSKSIERGNVGKLVKKMSGYQCQICKGTGMKTQTFRTNRGHNYVEAHHVIPVSLGQEGTLSPRNVIAVCASHHRELHYGAVARVSDLGSAYRIVVEGGVAVLPKNFQTRR